MARVSALDLAFFAGRLPAVIFSMAIKVVSPPGRIAAVGFASLSPFFSSVLAGVLGA